VNNGVVANKDSDMPSMIIPTNEANCRPFFEAGDGLTMRAAVLHGFDDLRLEEVPRPLPTGAGTVLVRIRACGVCATDHKAVRGIRRNVQFPFIAGHEPSGVVAAVGPGVRHFRVGDEVICQPSAYCGFCKHCRVGNTHYC
jgi:D-arabinose 1-dehydrogenase-like Zn-dependent alcohol dehydrogenase